MSGYFNFQLPSGEVPTASQDARPTMAERHQSVPVPSRSRPESLTPASRPHSIMSTGSAGSRDRHTLVRLSVPQPQLLFLSQTKPQSNPEIHLTMICRLRNIFKEDVLLLNGFSLSRRRMVQSTNHLGSVLRCGFQMEATTPNHQMSTTTSTQ